MGLYRETGKPISSSRHSSMQRSCSLSSALCLQWEGVRPPEAARETSMGWAFWVKDLAFHICFCAWCNLLVWVQVIAGTP